MEAAKRAIFRLMVVAQVEREARKALRAAGRESGFDALLGACIVIRRPDAGPIQLRRYKSDIWAKIQHEADAEVGVAVRCARPRPKIFVSSNTKHWHPDAPGTPPTALLGGIAVLSSRQFANLINP